MKIKKVSNHILLTSEGYITTNNNISIEERPFFKTLRVRLSDVDNYRDALESEIAEWKEYKQRQEEEYANG